MKALTAYLNRLSREEQDDFARRCETSVGYLRKAVSKGQMLGEKLCINIDRESRGLVPCESLRDDVDWDYLRNKASYVGLRDGSVQPQCSTTKAA